MPDPGEWRGPLRSSFRASAIGFAGKDVCDGHDTIAAVTDASPSWHGMAACLPLTIACLVCTGKACACVTVCVTVAAWCVPHYCGQIYGHAMGTIRKPPTAATLFSMS